MKKNVFILLACCLLTLDILAQAIIPANDVQSPKASSNIVGLGISFPLGVFNQTHNAGISINYSRSNDRYGRSASTKPMIKFAMSGGVSYQPGKKTTTAGYEFQYGDYVGIHAMAGIDYKPTIPINANLTAGPVMSIYKGNTDLGFGSTLFFSYYLSQKIAIGPGILFTKFEKTDALWSATIRASYAF